MYQLGGLSFSLGSEIAPGSRGDDSSPIYCLLQKCVQRGMKGAGEGTFYYSYCCSVIMARQNQKTPRGKIHPVLLRASLRTEEVLCLSGLPTPVYVHPKKWSWDCSVSPEEEKTVLVMWGDYKFRYLESLKVKLGVDCWRPFLLGLHRS